MLSSSVNGIETPQCEIQKDSDRYIGFSQGRQRLAIAATILRLQQRRHGYHLTITMAFKSFSTTINAAKVTKFSQTYETTKRISAS